MLVDDDDNLRDTMTKLLTALFGVEIASFPDGTAALKAYSAAPESFGFVVSDLDMPGMSGIDLCRHIHQIKPHLKVLLASGSGVITDGEARDYGFCGLLRKPFSVSSLQTVLAKAAGLKSDQHESKAAA
jgi:DNA-binding NtrC family response regulator